HDSNVLSTSRRSSDLTHTRAGVSLHCMPNDPLDAVFKKVRDRPSWVVIRRQRHLSLDPACPRWPRMIVLVFGRAGVILEATLLVAGKSARLNSSHLVI